MVIVAADGSTVSAPLAGLPAVVAAGQGGLLDVAVDPQFASDPWVYWTYAEAGAGGSGTTVARARLVGTALQDVAVIFRQTPKVSGSGHFGSRLAFRGDGTLFVTLGERQLGTPAQDVTGHLGKVVRIRRDGTVPADNPSFGASARPELWSIGHRNPQGAAVHPDSGDLWLTEHGPQGGDELNHVRPGANHGWPLRSYGCNYGDPVGTACRIGGGAHAPAFAEPVSFWAPPSTAPSGLMFYSGSRFPEWRGHAFTGALAGSTLWRLALDGDRVVDRVEIAAVKALGERIRVVKTAPDGWIVMLTDSGKLLRLQR
jgi:glucose/arabinose dehydrogenase